MTKLNEINKWLKSQKNKQKISVKEKDISNLTSWNFNLKEIFHESKKFFSIIGIRVLSNFYKRKTWDQPIIFQNENGILGILRRVKNEEPEYLLRANVEPGNINKLQISPTVQATKSNYTRVHGGKKIKYLNFFLKKKEFLINSKQTEQGFNYLLKKNKNILINVNKTIKLAENYRWIKKKNLISLIKKKNILNMDTLSVFSCSIKKNIFDKPVETSKDIKIWLKKMNRTYFIKLKFIPLNKMKDWILTKKNIFHKKKSYFSIIGVAVSAKSREVSYWNQPLIRHRSLHFAGFVTKKINNTTHYLVKFIIEPGYKFGSVTCTVKSSNISNYRRNLNLSIKSRYILKKIFFKKKGSVIKYDAVQSHEGGRFFKSQVRYMVVELKNNQKILIDKTYKWVSHNQMISLIKKGNLDIEGRLCFACYNFENII
jgi:dTDP-4-dehydro-6-deoxy-alpha-D-glucopyranose 2,3-dehydratase